MGIFGGPGLDKVMAKGGRSSALVVGIDVSYRSTEDGTERIDDYALHLATGEEAGVRQRLDPDARVRLGMQVDVAVLDGAVAIDWAASGARSGFDGANVSHRYKVLKQAPAAGIVDEPQELKSARRKGEPCQITITAIDQRSYIGGMIQLIDLTATVAATGTEVYETVLKRASVAFYATHLLAAGVTVPGFVASRHLDKPVIDWAAAAVARPGVDEPPALQSVVATEVEPGREVVDALGKIPKIGGKLQALAGGTGPAPEVVMGPGGPVVDGIDLATYVHVQVGLQQDRVPPADYEQYASERGIQFGTWAATEAAWNRAMTIDWKVGAAFGEAFEAERKARKKRR